MDFVAATNLLLKALEVLKTFNSIKKESEFLIKQIELQTILGSALDEVNSIKTEYTKLLDSYNAIKQESAKLAGNKAQREKYELKEVAVGVRAYIPKDFKDSVGQRQWYCQNCFDNHQRFSEYLPKDLGEQLLIYCPNCPSKFKIPNPGYKPIPPKKGGWQSA